jgi:hypothetical protein
MALFLITIFFFFSIFSKSIIHFSLKNTIIFCGMAGNFLIFTKITYLFGIIPRYECFLQPEKHKSHPKKSGFRIAK